MKRLVYKPSKIGKIGFVLISAALFLAFIEIASPDAQAQLDKPEKSASASDQRVENINQAVKSITSRVKDSATEQSKQSRFAGIDPRQQKSADVKSQAQKMGEEVTRLAKNATDQARAKAEDDETCNRCDRESRDTDPEGKKEPARTTRQTKTVAVRTVEKPVAKQQVTNIYHYDKVEKHVNHDDNDYHQPVAVARRTTQAVVEHDYPAPAVVKRDYKVEKTYAQPATRAAVVRDYEHQPTYVAAERDVVVIPKELPSTGPGAPVVLSLGGVVAALLARKFFGA